MRSRGIELPVPGAIRFARLRHRPSGLTLPCMVALVNRPQWSAIHRTWLKEDGSGKAEVEPPRMALSEIGRGVVRLCPPSRVMGLAEGIETALSATQLTGVTCWSAISAGNLEIVDLPPGVQEVHIFADDDERGRAAGNIAMRHFLAQGRRTVKLRLPPEGYGDYNDYLTGRKRP